VTPRPFPWDAVMHTGLGLLRLSPTTFWALTPLEFFALAGGMRAGRGGMGRAVMDGLMGRFPDG
jgi:uncharacterized phage protein (TIGR02216 family)